MDINKMKLQFGEILKVTWQNIDHRPLALVISSYKQWLDSVEPCENVGYFIGVHKAWMVLCDTKPYNDYEIPRPRIIPISLITNIQKLEGVKADA